MLQNLFHNLPPQTVLSFQLFITHRHEKVEHVLDVVEWVDELLDDLGHGLEDGVVVDRGQRSRQRDQVLQ